MLIYEQRKWYYERQILAYTAKRRKNKIKAALVLLLGYEAEMLFTNRPYTKKRYWEHPIYKLRNQHGFYKAILSTLSIKDDEKFLAYIRMTKSQFIELLKKTKTIQMADVTVPPDKPLKLILLYV